MASAKGTLRVCEKRHRYHKSSDCPTCPICEEERKPETGFLSLIAAPARRALERAGITTLDLLTQHRESDILKLHGMGPNAIERLRQALKSAGRSFKD